MATALAVVSLYFLHLGFKTTSCFYLSLGGIAAGLCLASSISGKQYLLALAIAAPLYGAFHWTYLKQQATWKALAIVVYGFVAAAMPIVLYIIFNRASIHCTSRIFFAISGIPRRRPPFQSVLGNT